MTLCLFKGRPYKGPECIVKRGIFRWTDYILLETMDVSFKGIEIRRSGFSGEYLSQIVRNGNVDTREYHALNTGSRQHAALCSFLCCAPLSLDTSLLKVATALRVDTTSFTGHTFDWLQTFSAFPSKRSFLRFFVGSVSFLVNYMRRLQTILIFSFPVSCLIACILNLDLEPFGPVSFYSHY